MLDDFLFNKEFARVQLVGTGRLPSNLGICGLYERKLKDLNPAIGNISYDMTDLYNFIDGLADMSALVYDGSIKAYLPYDGRWIKQRILQHLKRLTN